MAEKTEEKKEKFSGNKLLIKLTSRKLFITLIATIFFFFFIYKKMEGVVASIIVGGFIAIAIIFMIGDPIEQALALAVSKMELKINNSVNTTISNTVGPSANLSGTASNAENAKISNAGGK
jgi:uncharacterized membrane protein